MDSTDIDPTAAPTEKRWTSHVFLHESALERVVFASGSRVRICDNPQYPPVILFDAIYAGAVLHRFGTQALKVNVTANWQDAFYPGGGTTAEHVDYETMLGERTFNTERKRKQNQDRERNTRHEIRNTPDALDMLLMLPYVLVPPNELQAVFREAKEKEQVAEQRRVQEKVEAWIGQVPAP